MIEIEQVIGQMSANAEAIRALLAGVSEEQAQWKPAPESWSLREVMGHLYNEERGDFITHLRETLAEPPKEWGALRVKWLPAESCRAALESFLAERAASLDWLKALGAPDWERKIQATFGPADGAMTLSAGDLLASWVAHDYLHIRQINELLYGWNAKQAAPCSVEYAGGW